MNDRFKFRIWHEGEMHYNDFVITSTGYAAKIDEEFLGKCVFNQENLEFNKQAVVMQCTGLKDRNEKLIYEGDIVKYTSKKSKTNPEKAPYTENYKIVWQEKYTGYNLQSKEKVNCFNLGIMTDDIEVVGNIYENKELLEDTDER